MSSISDPNMENVDIDDEEFFDSETEPPLIQILINNEEPQTSSHNNITKNTQTTTNSSLNTPTRSYTPIYAVQFKSKPNFNTGSNLLSNSRIFINALTAMKLCKQDPEYRRFKVFKNFKDAYAFSYEAEIESGKAPTIEQVKASLVSLDNETWSPLTDRTNNGETSSPATNGSNNPPTSLDVEKLPYSAPKKADVNQLRLLVEKDDFEQFTDRVASNPRYLISAGDAPVVVQEAFRYNLLHTCAKSNRPQICEYILNLLSSTRFIQKLYRNDTNEQSKARSNHLLDLYLNTPEKGLSETPLHFACKFGSYEVAKVLISFEICCKTPLNKNGKTPEDLICTHASSLKDNFEAIKTLFEDFLFVPLYRDDDRGDVKFDKPSPRLSKSLNLEPDFNYLRLNPNQLSPNLNLMNQSQHKLAGYFGPLSPTVAYSVYERLKAPARIRQSPIERDIVRGDDLKGYERIARKVTEDMNVPFHEHWSFLGDTFLDIKTRDGLEKIEIYLKQKLFQNILESQKKIANEIKNEIQAKPTLITSNSKILEELTSFLDIIELLKKKFELKENVLTEKYEIFYRLMQVYSTKSQSLRLPIKFNSIKTKSSSIPKDLIEDNEQDFYEYLINDLLSKYVANVIELSRLDKTGRSHLNLYKPLKVLLELINAQQIFEHFYLTPAFKRTFITNHRIDKFAIKSKLSFDIEEDGEEKKPNENFRTNIRSTKEDLDDEDNDDENNYDDAEVSLLEELPTSSHNNNNDNDDLSDFLSKKLGAIKLDANENHIPLTNITNNPFGGAGLLNTRKTEDTNFLRPSTNNQFLERLLTKKQKLFMHGDAPSKLDRAVYLAIQDVSQENFKNLNLLAEWLDYMKYCNPQEMQQWKTPKKPTSISRLRN